MVFEMIKHAPLIHTTLYIPVPTEELFLDFDAPRHSIGVQVYFIGEGELIRILDTNKMYQGPPTRNGNLDHRGVLILRDGYQLELRRSS